MRPSGTAQAGRPIKEIALGIRHDAVDSSLTVGTSRISPANPSQKCSRYHFSPNGRISSSNGC